MHHLDISGDHIDILTAHQNFHYQAQSQSHTQQHSQNQQQSMFLAPANMDAVKVQQQSQQTDANCSFGESSHFIRPPKNQKKKKQSTHHTGISEQK